MKSETLTTFENRERVLENFDFEKVHAYMTLTNWTWRGNEKPPTIQELESTATTLMYKIDEDPKETSVQGTGGFYAYKFPWGIKLTFEPFRSQSF